MKMKIEMKEGWDEKMLKEIGIAQTGTTPKTADKDNYGDFIPFIKPADIDIYNDGEIRYDNDGLSKKGLQAGRKMTDGSILMVCIGATIGKVGFVDRDVSCNQQVNSLTVKKEFHPKFVYYALSTPSFYEQVIKNSAQATLPIINKGKWECLTINYPKSLPEQQRIVSILDEAFAAIAVAKNNAEKNLKNAKELFESYLQGVFEKKGDGWEEKTLGEVCDFTQGIQRDVKLQSENQNDNQVRFLRIVDFTQGNEPPRYIDNPGDKYILNSNDVSLVRYGASTGFVCRGLEGALANNLFRVIPKSKKEISNDFLFVYLTAPVFQNVIKESMNGAAMPAISFGLIKDIPFPIISIKEQETIVKKLDALSFETKRLEAIYRQKSLDLEELKKSVLQKAFNGEL